MDAATLIMILKLADGREVERVTPFRSLAACQAFKAEVATRLPAGWHIVAARCKGPVRLSD